MSHSFVVKASHSTNERQDMLHANPFRRAACEALSRDRWVLAMRPEVARATGRVAQKTHLLRTCIRKEKAAVPATKVNTLEVFISKFSSSSPCPARSLRGSLGGLDQGSGRYLQAGGPNGREGMGGEGKLSSNVSLSTF